MLQKGLIGFVKLKRPLCISACLYMIIFINYSCMYTHMQNHGILAPTSRCKVGVFGDKSDQRVFLH